MTTPQGAEYGHDPRGGLIQLFADAVFEHGIVNRAVPFGEADAFAEGPERLRRVAPAAESGQGRHARVVPAAHVLVCHQGEQLAFAHDRIGQVQAGRIRSVGG